ncbi:MAG: AsnC family transcriptional regulator [Dehalococcoidia bacterium]|nr:AsnC family transcriptional regulator [Dehalococcoidia bacterium]
MNTMPQWSFLTNHAKVLLHVSLIPENTGLEIAHAVGITERATRKVIADLNAAGYLDREKLGRRNRYNVDIQRPVDRIQDRDITVGRLLDLLWAPDAVEMAGVTSQPSIG